jgi:vacuolar-type H+-ATPase subunit E/Vma4
MALDDLLRALLAEAEAAVQLVERDTATALAQVAADTAAREVALREQLERETTGRHADAARRLRSAARMEEQQRRRWVCEELAAELREAVLAELERAVAGPGYAAAWQTLLAEARQALPAGSLVQVCADDLTRVSAPGLELRADLPDSELGGLVLADDQGHRLRNTLRTRFESLQPLLRRKLHAALFAGAEP